MKKDHGQFSDKFARDLKEHLATFNDGVIAIIITVMVLEIPAPQLDAALPAFLKAIGNYQSVSSSLLVFGIALIGHLLPLKRPASV